MIREFFFAASLAAIPCSAVAQIERQDGDDITNAFSKSYQDCQIYGEVHNTIARTDCSDNELALQDRRLNATYKAVMGRLSPARKTDLRADQRNWIVARDEKCAQAEDYDKADCLSYETIKRIRYFGRIK